MLEGYNKVNAILRIVILSILDDFRFAFLIFLFSKFILNIIIHRSNIFKIFKINNFTFFKISELQSL